MNNRLIKYEDPETVKKLIAKLGKAVCPQCGTIYTMGKTGVIGGCDECLKIERDRNGMIINIMGARGS